MQEQKVPRPRFLERGAKQTANPAYQRFQNLSSKGIGRLARMGAKFWLLSTTGRVRGNLRLENTGEIILDHTPFYAESGGQVGDRGWFYSDDHNTVVADVTGCYSPIQGVRAHQVVMKSPPSAKNAEGCGTCAWATELMLW